jgi:hypothetical protein
MSSFGCGRASSRALGSTVRTRRARRIGAGVLLGASLVACFDSKRIIFTSDTDLSDAGGAGGAPPAPQSRATGVAPAPVAPENERAAAPGILEATALGADDGVSLDAGLVTGAVDASAPDAAP